MIPKMRRKREIIKKKKMSGTETLWINEWHKWREMKTGIDWKQKRNEKCERKTKKPKFIYIILSQFSSKHDTIIFEKVFQKSLLTYLLENKKISKTCFYQIFLSFLSFFYLFYFPTKLIWYLSELNASKMGARIF